MLDANYWEPGVALRLCLLGVIGWACSAPGTPVLYAQPASALETPSPVASPRTPSATEPAPAPIATITPTVLHAEGDEAPYEPSGAPDDDTEGDPLEDSEHFDEPEQISEQLVVDVDVSRLTPKELRAIKEQMIAASMAEYDGPCPCPYNTMRNGRACGGRSAYSRPGGESPLCYQEDVTVDMVRAFLEGVRGGY